MIGEMKILENGNLRIITEEHGTTTLTRWKIQPLGLSELEKFHSQCSVDIIFTDLSVLEDGKITQIKVKANIPNDLKGYCLVKGGWLPPGFGMLRSTVISDRNFVTKLVTAFHNNKPKIKTLEGWFDDLSSFGFTIDILQYAMEGNKKDFPTFDEVCSQVSEAVDKIKHSIPSVFIEEYTGTTIQDYAWKLLEYLKPTITKRKAFLTDAAPSIKTSRDTTTIKERWNSIISAARTHSLPTSDISVILALLTVSGPQKNSPGLGVFKIAHPYPQELAYNACFDISLLELFINFQRIFPEKNYVIATADVAFARLGAILNDLTHESSDGEKTKLSTSIPPELLANGNIELYEEFKILTSR